MPDKDEYDKHDLSKVITSQRKHILTRDCWCNPEIEEQGVLIIHQKEVKGN